MVLYNKNRWYRSRSFGSQQFFYVFHPKMFALGSLAVVYPYTFIFIILFLRYNNLGTTLNLNYSFEILLLVLIIIILLFAYFHIVNEFIFIFLRLKNYFWEKTAEFSRIIYLFLLQKNWFFLILQKIHKIYFYFYLTICLSSEVYWNFDYSKDFSFFRKFLDFILKNKVVCSYTLFLLLFLEIILSQKIYYFYYFLYIYFIFYLFWNLFYILRNALLYYDCVESDYIYRNFSKPRFPYDFFDQVEAPLIFFSFSLKLTKKDIFYMKKLKVKVETARRENKYFFNSIYHKNRAERLFEKVNTKKYPLYYRIAAYYYSIFLIKP